MWLLSVYNSYKYARTIPSSIACYWFLSLKCLARTLFFFVLSVIDRRISYIDYRSSQPPLNGQLSQISFVLFYFYRYFYYLYAIIFFSFFVIFFDMFASNACHENTFALYWCYNFTCFFSSICLVIQLHKYEYSK